mmetsp:Transcript_10438/g.24824  ORF Transcript_10438/g.24824 Transcript_10438/m.24824 type:complete len:373 (+) Transcript_10438:122-1240(+)|eukprot:CAMPEP_0172402070 /NCGR_PEP_ID=MMETSP1061-20121228/53189_1 /TAXON_ID=37318 /ORGANISM="Pseudo-nitzschia pungens, Strain cf. pungens" /LENGTH=372 /DNA_ID=CAMNT_0013135933 /DNA_START=134 /DNA_END=1252 /DNA_ORIENTATION=+
MKQLFSGVLAFALAMTNARKVDAITGSDLYERWKIETPRVSLISDNNTIIMDYGVSELITHDNIRAKIFAENCEYPLLNEGILSESFDAQGAHVFRIDPRTISKNPEVTKYNLEESKAQMTFCLHYMLWSGPESDDGSILINEQETILIIHMSLKAGAFLGFSVQRRGAKSHTEALEAFHAIGYLCDPITYEMTEVPEGSYLPGELITVCAELNPPQAVQEGLYLKRIDEFVWTLDRSVGDEVVRTEQYSVKDGVASADGLTEYDCVTEKLCVFNTILRAEFFLVPGYIYGSGSTTVDWIIFMDDETRNNFGLGPGRKLRSLQTFTMEISVPVTNWRPRPKVSAAGVATVFSPRNLLSYIACSVIGSFLLSL